MAGTTARYSLTHGIPAVRIGWLIAEARSNAGLASDDLADRLGVKHRIVKRWEKGSQIPSDDEVLAVARACGIGVGVLFPPRDTVEFDRSARSLRVGAAMVSVSDVHNEAVLTTYVQLVRQQRGLPDGSGFEIRHEDVDALASTLDLDDDELEARLVSIVGMAAEAAAGMRDRLLARRRMGLGAGLMVGSLGIVPGAATGDAVARAVQTPPPAVAHVAEAAASASPVASTVDVVRPDVVDPANATDELAAGATAAAAGLDPRGVDGGAVHASAGEVDVPVEIGDALHIVNPDA